METEDALECDLKIGPGALEAYSRLSYTMWHALGEFIDNSTQSRLNYGAIIDEVLVAEGAPLIVDIKYNRITREIRIRDNSIGMTKSDLIEGLKIANPTKDSYGRSKYGMGMKTSACWIGAKWKVITSEWASGAEWTAAVDVKEIAQNHGRVQLSRKDVSNDEHYTEIVIHDLHRNIQRRTEETIKAYLGSMYRFDLRSNRLQILFNDEPIAAPDEYEMDTDPDGVPMKRDIPETMINGKIVKGWVGVLRKGGRRYGGFSLFQNQRQIQGFPTAWKPRSIFGGVDDEGANNLVAQRLVGELQLDGFDVSHTKDAIIYQADEEEELEKLLIDATRDYIAYAQKRRGSRGNPWNRDKMKDMLAGMKSEFVSGEMADAISHSILPPIQVIESNNHALLAALDDADKVVDIQVSVDLKVTVSLQEKSEYEPNATIVTGAVPGNIHLIINGLHPYYASIESTDALDECLRQYIYDAIAEYKVSQSSSPVVPNSVRRLKDAYLRAKVVHIENAAVQESSPSANT